MADQEPQHEQHAIVPTDRDFWQAYYDNCAEREAWNEPRLTAEEYLAIYTGMRRKERDR